MSEQWIPTTEQVRLGFAESPVDEYYDRGERAFNRWLEQVKREAKIEALREAARELQKDVERSLGANAHPREVGRRDGLQKSWSLLHALADRMEAGE